MARKRAPSPPLRSGGLNAKAFMGGEADGGGVAAVTACRISGIPNVSKVAAATSLRHGAYPRRAQMRLRVQTPPAQGRRRQAPPQAPALCSTRRRPSNYENGTPRVPTPPVRHRAQGGSRAKSEASLEAPEHDGTSAYRKDADAKDRPIAVHWRVRFRAARLLACRNGGFLARRGRTLSTRYASSIRLYDYAYRYTPKCQQLKCARPDNRQPVMEENRVC